MIPERRLIVTADDFGLSAAVNEAVERAHRDGILTAASLMVAAPAREDAVRRARALPALRVGLHVVVVNGRPMLPPAEVPHLVDANGEFATDLVRAGVRYFFDLRARRELEAEIRAQFEAFRRTGLPLDHVNAHNHFHVHPMVLATIVRVGRDYGLRSVRVPYEPFVASWRSAHRDLGSRLANDFLLAPWMSLMRARLRRAGIVANDRVFGLGDTGRMDAERILRLIAELPAGVTELYLHPQAGNEELAGLIDPRVVEALRRSGVLPFSFTELAAAHAA